MQEGGDRPDSDGMLAGTRHLRRIRRGTDVQRQQVERLDVAVGQRKGLGDEVEPDDGIADEARAGPLCERRQVDVRFRRAVVPRDQAGEHSGIGGKG
jgi:hypothetical protein